MPSHNARLGVLEAELTRLASLLLVLIDRHRQIDDALTELEGRLDTHMDSFAVHVPRGTKRPQPTFGAFGD